VSAQLIDAETGNHIWAQSYDRELEDIFALQDEIGDTIVASVTPEIGHVEQDRAQRKPPENLNAWDLYQRGLAAYYTTTEEGLASAIELFGKVHQLDPSFAPAFAMEADSLVRYMLLYQPEDPRALIDQARKQAHKGMALAPRDPICLWADGRVHSFLGNHDIAISKIEEAIVLNPNYAMAYYVLGAALVFAGRAEKAISHLDHAMRLSPQDGFLGGFQHMRAAALFSLKQYEECAEWARRAAHSPNPRAWSFAFLSAALTKLGREDEAQFALDEAIVRAPNFSLSFVRRTPSILDEEAQERLLETLGDAGLPE
jgi:tetratricopeptide (TPR) repeat protein